MRSEPGPSEIWSRTATCVFHGGDRLREARPQSYQTTRFRPTVGGTSRWPPSAVQHALSGCALGLLVRVGRLWQAIEPSARFRPDGSPISICAWQSCFLSTLRIVSTLDTDEQTRVYHDQSECPEAKKIHHAQNRGIGRTPLLWGMRPNQSAPFVTHKLVPMA